MTSTNHPSASESGELNLDHLEALARAATPGKWAAMPHGRIVGGPLRRYVNGSAPAQIASLSVTYHDQAPEDEPERQQANTEFVAAANPAAVLKLIALARRAAPVAAPTAGDALTDERIYDIAAASDLGIGDDEYEMSKRNAFARAIEREVAALANQPAPTVPATLPDAAALMYNALNDAYQSSVFDGEELRQVVRALAAYNRSRSGPAALAHQPAQEQAEREQTLEAAPHISSAQQEPVAAPQQAAAPGALEGRLVSVDVSTGEDDYANRIFAELTGETGSDGTTLIAVEKSRNFSAPGTPEAPNGGA